VDRILRSKGIDTDADPETWRAVKAPEKLARTLVRLDDGIAAGTILSVKKGPAMVERMGAPFVGEPKYARWGKPELVGSMLRYAYHRPATEAEIELAAEACEDISETDTDMAGP
jgi:hypothetical protein